jgi:tRNA-binding protein
VSGAAGAAAAPITWDDFLKVDVRVGRIVAAEPFPEARNPAFRLRLDFGELGERRSSAQITKRYRAEELVGRLVVAVVNFPPKRIAGFLSEVLVLGVYAGEGDVVLLQPDLEVAPGQRVG